MCQRYRGLRRQDLQGRDETKTVTTAMSCDCSFDSAFWVFATGYKDLCVCVCSIGYTVILPRLDYPSAHDVLQKYAQKTIMQDLTSADGSNPSWTYAFESARIANHQSLILNISPTACGSPDSSLFTCWSGQVALRLKVSFQSKGAIPIA
jgi:hypothetical protein